MDLVSPTAIENVTTEEFATEERMCQLVSCYYINPNFTASQLNGWMGKESSFGLIKRKMINKQRLRGRTLHVVKEDLRGKKSIAQNTSIF